VLAFVCAACPTDADGAAVPSQLLHVSQSTAQLQQGLLKSGACDCLLHMDCSSRCCSQSCWGIALQQHPALAPLLPMLLLLLLLVLLSIVTVQICCLTPLQQHRMSWHLQQSCLPSAMQHMRCCYRMTLPAAPAPAPAAVTALLQTVLLGHQQHWRQNQQHEHRRLTRSFQMGC
jgi:hypothetical protein